MSKTSDHRTWTEAFAEELAEIKKRRGEDEPRDRALVGLALSGGGIRSATFALGILESLRTHGWLKKIDYLSSVSGGGYIASWLSAACRRHPDWLERTRDWTPSISYLRRYSNYLSPKVGFFSADTWSMATIWLRNTVLIQITVMLVIAFALFLPRPLFEVFLHWPSVGSWRWATVVLFVFGAVGIAGNEMRLTSDGKVPWLRAERWRLGLLFGAVFGAAAWAYGEWIDFDPFHGGEVSYLASAPIAALLVLAGFSLQPFAVRLVASVWPDDDPPQQVNYTQNWVQGAVVIPLMAAGYLVAAILWGESTGIIKALEPGRTDGAELMSLDGYGALFTAAWRYWPFPLSVVFASMFLLSFCAIRSRKDWRCLLAAAGAPLVAVPVLHALLCAIMLLLHGWALDPALGAPKAFVWGPPLVALAFVLTIVILIGMMGRQSTDDVREWWSRLGAFLGIYATAWMVIAVSAVYGPSLVQLALDSHPATWMTAGGGWIGTVVAGLLAGNSPSTGSGSKKSTLTKVKELLAAIAPFVFIAGLLVGVAYLLDQVVVVNADKDWIAVGAGAASHALHSPFLSVSLMVGGACLIGMLLMAWRVDINEFSLNAFYRNRLVRCYGGATRFAPGERNPQNFTGFDSADDIRLTDLLEPGHAAPGPLHIVNCALNLGGSSDLALHTRHSAAFTLTPLHCGTAYRSREQTGETEEIGFVPTGQYCGVEGSPTLGQAISVSGAAASPNMGYHTSPVVAFLLTVFNVRLGWWFPHPRRLPSGAASPRFSLKYLFAELFGGANDQSQFLSVSDGGHFENLAAYELVRRRCRVIIVSDGECDEALTFSGLGTLIRMCEVDFGAKITIDVSALRTGTAAWSSKQWAIGRIDYGAGGADGILIYLKASMTGHEDTSVLQYKSSHPSFPHEPTGDQFYGEDQFESYRHLGRTVGHDVFAALADPADVVAAASTLLSKHVPDVAFC